MKPELSTEEQSKDRFFAELAEVSKEMVEAHGKDFAMGALVLAAGEVGIEIGQEEIGILEIQVKKLKREKSQITLPSMSSACSSTVSRLSSFCCVACCVASSATRSLSLWQPIAITRIAIGIIILCMASPTGCG